MKVISVFLFLFFSLSCYGQHECLNRLGAGNKVYTGLRKPQISIMATVSTPDKGYGAMVNTLIWEEIGAYASFTKGSYWLPYTYQDVPHYKFVLGPSYNFQVLPSISSYLLGGVSYNNHHGRNLTERDIAVMKETYYHYDKLTTISAEFGFGIIIKWFTCDVRIDPFRGEVAVDAGFTIFK